MNKSSIFFSIVAFLIVFLPSSTMAESRSLRFDLRKERGVRPMMFDVNSLDSYRRHLVFASRYIEEGDYESAMENLASAKKISDDDPMLYEMLGIVYDADRQSEKAFGYFKKAGEMYFNAGNLNKARNMVGWMRTIDMHAEEVKEMESKLKERQEVINRKRLQ